MHEGLHVYSSMVAVSAVKTRQDKTCKSSKLYTICWQLDEIADLSMMENNTSVKVKKNQKKPRTLWNGIASLRHIYFISSII